jgi:hypothetical protein
MGTNLVSGTATALVLLTGARTQFGSLAKSVVNQRALTSFDKGVNRVTWVLIRFMLVMVPVVFLLNGFVKGDWKEAFLFAIAVAVGLTPEMLPMVVTANLARGAIAMSRHKVIVKRLNAIQNLGAMDVLCSDKTGTLTQDKVVLEVRDSRHRPPLYPLVWQPRLIGFTRSALPDLQQHDGNGEGRRSENQAGRAEHNQATDDGHERGDRVELQPVSNQDGIDHVVDAADDDSAPEGQNQRLHPAAFQREHESGRDPYDKGTEYRDHGQRGHHESPE